MMNSINAANAYSAARNAVQPGAPTQSAVQRAGQAAEDFAAHMAQVDRAATGAMTGSVETHQLVQTIAEAELAMETVVAIRDKVVEAYQEILRMPV
ncbi:flagellar hook-basal body complex protein FliE [Paracoccus sp. (in: a-proteobacteria)]|uniref:flagellar hook-basal body complex protein FliE n=1 Tax=Paracoccus sp. TaxID=267 RepID=UPI0026DF697D|nr:flagellar hook-basal body complex protein FliE [Paracoccus sp. (in: a-proteobacteria)]MDO5648313.1 flagellar hook-basal body complex protein FliE [Paracoccus sp. (in: a-proteobacteria)]